MDFRDIILTTIGAILAALGTYLAPAIRRSSDAFPGMMESQVRIASVLTVLSRVCYAMQEEDRRDRSVVVVVEDTVSHGELVKGLCEKFLHDHPRHLSMTIVPLLSDAYSHLSEAAVFVIDVGLPDADLLDIQSFVAHVRTPVVIHTASEYPKGTFPPEIDVITKWDNDALIRAINKALSSSRNHRC